jgi:hypothetical protein
MMGIGLEDMESEGHNADNESLASYLSGALASFPDNDHIPTRDTGNADNESLASYLSGALASFPDNDHIPVSIRDTGNRQVRLRKRFS